MWLSSGGIPLVQNNAHLMLFPIEMQPPALLSPVVALGVQVLGTISDA